jgi:tripartite-type tricarboxylate transporter receptor subunit TctC
MVTFGRILLTAGLAFCLAVYGQDYPSKPITIVVPVAPGGGVDRSARILADKLRQKWGQPVIVENRPGATGNIGTEHVAKAVPDGYTLLAATVAQLVINKRLYSKLSYDSDAFVPISVITASPLVMVVHGKVAAANPQELIAFAKLNPGRLSYASQGSGSTAHLTAEWFKWMADIKAAHIPYKGVPPALTDMFGGRVDMTFLDLGNTLPYIRAGKLRALAVCSEKRNPLLPDVPATSEMLPGLVASSWFGMVATPGTPSSIADKLSAAIAEALQDPDVTKQLDSGLEVIGNTPTEMMLFMRQERERWANIIRITGATVD